MSSSSEWRPAQSYGQVGVPFFWTCYVRVVPCPVLSCFVRFTVPLMLFMDLADVDVCIYSTCFFFKLCVKCFSVDVRMYSACAFLIVVFRPGSLL